MIGFIFMISTGSYAVFTPLWGLLSDYDVSFVYARVAECEFIQKHYNTLDLLIHNIIFI